MAMRSEIVVALLLVAVNICFGATDPLLKQCLKQKDCESCIAIIGCGWCGDSLVGWCLPGDEDTSNITAYFPENPEFEECPAFWWDYFSCAYAYQDTYVVEPYSYVDATNVASIVTSAETWYIQTYYDAESAQATFTYVEGVQTVISTQPDSLLIFSNTTSKALAGNFSDADPFALIGNVTDSAVGFYIDLISLVQVVEYTDAPQAGWTCPSYEDLISCPLAEDMRDVIDFTDPTVAVSYARDYQKLQLSVTYQTLPTASSPSVPLVLELSIWNASHPAVQGNPNVDVFTANLTITVTSYTFNTSTTSLSVIFLVNSVFSEGDFLSQNPDNITAMNISEADPSLLQMELEPGWIERKGILGSTEPKIRMITFSFVQSKQNANSKRQGANTLQVQGRVTLEEPIPRSFSTLLGSRKKSKAGLIAGVTCGVVFVVVLIVAAVLIFKFNIMRPRAVSVGSSRGGRM